MAEEQRFDPQKSHPEKDVKEPNLIEKAKEASKISHDCEKSPSHDKETHGLSNEIDEDTPIDKVKGPGVFERAKEEVEALVGSILPKKK